MGNVNFALFTVFHCVQYLHTFKQLTTFFVFGNFVSVYTRTYLYFVDEYDRLKKNDM